MGDMLEGGDWELKGLQLREGTGLLEFGMRVPQSPHWMFGVELSRKRGVSALRDPSHHSP
jgi:hypothetical protein